ncbi:MAG TPA: DNA topoisomerase IB [Solirubrobacteraceae bacterium]|nr:DNA topoisomerase IB [Solirubrobacteraceae bacterium]
MPGLRRRRRGRGFSYVDADGTPVDDEDTLTRIRALAIPPAWTDVWICPDPLGHLQATGVDAAGRKQYRYHDVWRARRDRQKFDEMIDFARALPRLRRRVARDLHADENGSRPGRDRVLACAARMLDLGFFRVGSESYAEGNGSYGLATIRKPHVHVTDDGVVFDYPAKSGQRRVHEIADPDVREIITALKRRRGGPDELLAYRKGRRWIDVRSHDINDYLKERAGAEISAKDFRTWNGTVLAAVALAELSERPPSRTARRRAVGAAVKQVAHYLGNTPAVARSSYIDPRVIDRFQSGETIAPLHKKGRSTIEKAVLDLIDG